MLSGDAFFAEPNEKEAAGITPDSFQTINLRTLIYGSAWKSRLLTLSLIGICIGAGKSYRLDVTPTV